MHEHVCFKISSETKSVPVFPIHLYCESREERSCDTADYKSFAGIISINMPLCIHNSYTLKEGLDWCFNAQKQTMLERVLCDIPPSILFISVIEMQAL